MTMHLNPTAADEPTGMSRRRFVASLGLIGSVASMAPRWLRAQDGNVVAMALKEAATSAITVQTLRGSISVLSGAGGNIAVLPGADGTLLIDGGYAVSRQKILDALARLGAGPVTHLVNTHWHFDHTDGNEWLHTAGASIVAHENTRRHLSTATRVDAWDHTFPPSPAGAIPDVVFRNEHALHFNRAAILLKYYGPAHTDSDIAVRCVDADVLHTGDTFWNGQFPFIDYSTGGSMAGAIRSAEANIAAVGADTLVVPGHGSVGGRADLVAFRDMLVTVRDKVASLKKQGLTVDDVIAAKPTAAYDATWGGFFISGKTFAALVYAGV
jgi:glyoxylase-like metal-dependent hydrolase (beta-lactamase superfamily II)